MSDSAAASEPWTTATPAGGFQLGGTPKLRFVTAMFDAIAAQYDTLNLLLSLGQTTVWRWMALTMLPLSALPRGARVLDVGTGTGAVPRLLHWRYPNRRVRVDAMDCSPLMLQRARELDTQEGNRYLRGDVGDLSSCVGSDCMGAYDTVVTVYTLRNFSDATQANEQMLAALKPGGTLILLDAFPPEEGDVIGRILTALLRVWLGSVVPMIAHCLGTEEKAYRYLAASVQGTRPASAVAAELRAMGCEGVRVSSYFCGACCRVFATKPTQGRSI